MLFKFMRDELLKLYSTIDDDSIAMCVGLIDYYIDHRIVFYEDYNDITMNLYLNRINILEVMIDHLFNIKEHISSQNYKNMCNGLMKYHKRLHNHIIK